MTDAPEQRQEKPMPGLTAEESAAERFRNSLLSRADAYTEGAPLWHGWAIFDAFMAGIRWQRERDR